MDICMYMYIKRTNISYKTHQAVGILMLHLLHMKVSPSIYDTVKEMYIDNIFFCYIDEGALHHMYICHILYWSYIYIYRFWVIMVVSALRFLYNDLEYFAYSTNCIFSIDIKWKRTVTERTYYMCICCKIQEVIFIYFIH